ncbi:MAG TPA: hypothetical protein VLC98_12995 [Phnomibacter sp.]|nr:hypothetical protein [Phnomibacter sp.]
MKIQSLTLLLTLQCLFALGQSKDTWIEFWNKDTTLFGYKDKNGIVKVEPKFQIGFNKAHKVDNIVAVSEVEGEHWKRYYLTKSGRIVGRDSLHYFDNAPDCESEGFIRFRDKKTDRVGMFDRNGDVAIPAEYNALTKVRNGMVCALKGATKKYWEGGEHYSWEGGRELLLDTANNLLVDSFYTSGNLNFFSLLVSAQPNPDTIRQNFKTSNGKYLSFVDFEKEFRAWLKSALLTNFTKDNLLNVTWKEVTCWRDSTGWIAEPQSSFIDRNFELIKSKLLQLNSKDCNYFISSEELNSLTFDSEEYDMFFNDCGEPKDWIYPVQNIVISYKHGNDIVQDRFNFLRTDNGYKLLSLTIREGKAKIILSPTGARVLH